MKSIKADKVELIKQLNESQPPCLVMLNSQLVDIDESLQSATLSFDIPLSFCHSGNVVQGGFVTAMLDAALSHSVFSAGRDILNVSTLEIKVSFLRPSFSGKFKSVGKITRIGGSIAFMAGELFDEYGTLTATATTTAKLVNAP